MTGEKSIGVQRCRETFTEVAQHPRNCVQFLVTICHKLRRALLGDEPREVEPPQRRVDLDAAVVHEVTKERRRPRTRPSRRRRQTASLEPTNAPAATESNRHRAEAEKRPAKR